MSLELHELEVKKERDLDRDQESSGSADRRSGSGGGGNYRNNDYGAYGGGNIGPGGLGPIANREVMQALNTLAHFNNMTNGSLFGGGYSMPIGGIARGGRQQTSNRGRDDRNGAVRNKFSPY